MKNGRKFWPSCDYSVLFLTKDQQMSHGSCQVQAGWPNIPNREGDVIRYILSSGYIMVRPTPLPPPHPPPAPCPPPWHKLTQLHDKPPLKRLPGLPVPACECLALVTCCTCGDRRTHLHTIGDLQTVLWIIASDKLDAVIFVVVLC